MPVRYTRELPAQAARRAMNVEDAMRRCGAPSPGGRIRPRQKMAEADTYTPLGTAVLGIDMPHTTVERY
ncbi:hypothetical protein [Streptomyces sp. FIT100]|uniref:hypothetical protein n=1 Tax=Streptomyces sp. FIT100 TaxID=2837956 RepID=UPI0021C9D2E4|nr:hypothetical protein [Streptomyces sp. FIT100]UUN27115.1 hypothetical protein KK483_12435 [Streptomyces sp. FIT100]